MNVDKAVLARIDKGGHHFEVLVDCEKAMEFRKGNASLDDALVSDTVFKDSKKGEHASEHDLANLFGTRDGRKAAEQIIKHGEIQLTTEYKTKIREEVKKQIITLISRNAVDPKTNLPHPPQRIELAMDDLKVKINEFKSAEEQVKEIVDKLRVVLPISYELRKINLKIPAEFGGRCFPILKKFGTVLKEDWLSDGSLSATVEVPAGLQNDLFDELNNLTHGRIESEILEKK